MVGFGVKESILDQQGPSKKCERCKLSYFSAQHDQCPHCTDLSESELIELSEMKAREAEGGKLIGRKMLVAAVLLLIGTFLILKILA